MSQWAYILDEDGDLVNLHKMECISLSPQDQDSEARVVQAVPCGNTESAYVLKRGTEEECRSFLRGLAAALSVDL